ncbi:hypothetical protein BT93_L4194 [Corymbia citriodora subsp. variegata]|uniref:Uncharacterized protein n=1 Tax=Corymbia citriodora subsp. variegata TaxID=360336 RepID=A0A8T0CKI8_CORYI|nr:hypothetical protein BT93_L4194 [Corymbia citriodora subsp. variegata]
MEVRQTPTADNSSVSGRRQAPKQAKPSPVPVDSTSVTQRLQKELMALMVCAVFLVHLGVLGLCFSWRICTQFRRFCINFCCLRPAKERAFSFSFSLL